MATVPLKLRTAAERSLSDYGRQAERRELRDARLFAYSADDIELAARRVVELISSEDPKTALAACKEVLDRSYGKPHQSSSVELSGGLESVSDEELEAEVIEILSARQGASH